MLLSEHVRIRGYATDGSAIWGDWVRTGPSLKLEARIGKVISGTAGQSSNCVIVQVVYDFSSDTTLGYGMVSDRVMICYNYP